MVPPLAPSAPPSAFDSSPRMSEDDEENAGLLHSYHTSQGEDYPPPASPQGLGSPFAGAEGTTKRQRLHRPFIALAALLFLAVFLAVSAFTPGSLRSKGYDATIRNRMHELPENELDKTKFRIEGSNPDYEVTAIVLHGLGQPNNEPPFVRKLATRFPYVRWVSPTADQLNVTVRGFEPTSAWFNIETFDDLSQGENVDEFVHSQQQLNEVVDDERDKMVRDGKEPRVVLMGFSQGAVMTLLGFLTANETSRYEGGIALSGYLPLLESLNDLVSPAARDIPLFWGHGKQDPYLTIEQARSGSKLLRSSKVGLRKLEFIEYDGLDHIWNEKELEDMAQWFGRTVPSKKPHRPTFRKSRPSRPSTPSPSSPPAPSFNTASNPDIEELIKIKEKETELEAERWVQVVSGDEAEGVVVKRDAESSKRSRRRHIKRYLTPGEQGRSLP